MSGVRDIITVDGPSGSGKSTISKRVAASLNYTYLDTGAMYRAVGYGALQQGIELTDQAKMQALLESIDIRLEPGEQEAAVFLNSRDVSAEIRTAEMGLVASKVSALRVVRQKLTALQQKIGGQGAVVAEGRDMGTVVFPAARYKFYLSATPEERARRRTAQLREKGQPADVQEILTQIRQRDHDDSTRALAPLKAAPDAIIIDSSKMSIDDVVHFMLEKITAVP